MTKLWHFLITEPFRWIFLVFFQPRRFKRELETQYPGRILRMTPPFRLIIPVFLTVLPFAIIGNAILLSLHLVSPDIANFFFTIAVAIALAIMFGISYGLAACQTTYTTDNRIVDITDYSAFDLSGAIIVTITIGIAGGIVCNIARGITVGITDATVGGFSSAIIVSLIVGLIVGLAGDITGDLAGDIKIGIAGGIISGIVSGIVYSMTSGLASGLAFGSAGATAGAIAGIIGAFHLPLYLVSGPSAFKAYYASRQTPTKVFDYLHRCSLYWDERVYLPLPYLKQTLLIAYTESPQKALEEIAFIGAERPQQARAARAAVLEIVMRDLEQRDSLEKMAGMADWLAALLPPEANLVDPRGIAAIAHMNNASRDAMRAIAPIGLRGRHKALDDLQTNLRHVYPNAFRNQRLNTRLAQVVGKWQEIARRKQEQLSHAMQDVGNIDDPYKPGQHLSLQDSLFVGRHGLAKKLEGALRLGSRRPTFLLNGERRMGKTSVLQQLPHLLGSRYIPVFYNLQESGAYASTEAFLRTLATGIQKEMNTRAMPVKSLQFGLLQGTRRASSPAAYRRFEKWLANVEDMLEQEQRTLLLTFDEFEILEEAEQAKYMDIRLLLNWMRTIIQFHPRIALLFSGTKTFNEMGKLAEIDWTGYFNNVQMLRVSFLHADEARHLITKPTPDFPGETIFPTDVVEMIITETGCHPFLVQAVCSALITQLNVEHREQATCGDVPGAIEKTLEGWQGHFINLWNRTDNAQHACLQALLVEPSANQTQLVLRTGLDEKTLRTAMQTLLRRDLVLRDQDETYRIAVPILRQWME